MAAIGIDAGRAEMLQSGDQSEHGSRLGGLRHLPQPSEPVLARVLPVLGQLIEAFALLGRQAVREAAMHLAPGLVTEIRTEPFQCRG